MARTRRGPARVALEEIRRHPVRTFLVSQGMIWAVALSVVPAAVIGGSRDGALQRAEELGTDLIQVGPDPGVPEGGIRESDLEALRESDENGRFSGLRVERVQCQGALGEIAAEGWLLGADSGLPSARGKPLLFGRFPVSTPGASVEVALERNLAFRLLGGDPQVDLAACLGSTLYLSRPTDGGASISSEAGPDAITFEVVGVVEDDIGGVDPFGNRQDQAFSSLVKTMLRAIGIAPAAAPWREQGLGIYLPRSEVPGDRIDWLFYRVDPMLVGERARKVSEVLVELGRTPLIYTNALWPILTSPELEGYLVLHSVFFWLFVLVGLAVLTNLLLLSGWQRRHEIALRRTEGATRGDIFAQFLWEGLFVAAVGLVLGMLCGMGLAYIRASLDTNVLMSVGWPWGEAARAGAILALGGLGAAAYPAWRASGFHPMALLRRR